MPIRPSPTPNPNAVKFVVGQSVGGPGTVTWETETDISWAAELLAIEGVDSVFFTADFVTVTKSPSAEWDNIVPVAESILETEFGT